ncbi:MAG: formimidoylglutamase [Bacteroidota bacterium]|nr:formimidoylglutamase [Bacteroidota bacterium]
MLYSLHILDYLDPINTREISNDDEYKDGQVGKLIEVYEEDFPDLLQADLVLVGCREERGARRSRTLLNGPDMIRRQFYQLYHWHSDIRLMDVGNVKSGSTLADTYAALRSVISELIGLGKTVIILGGSHDLTLAQYQSYVSRKKLIEVACVDALIDIDIDSSLKSENFLMELLTDEPNFIHHYNHIGFQSYYVHPRMLETMDKLRFDCFRVGKVKEIIDEMEPVLRNSNMLSFDICAIAHAYAPSVTLSPNGLSGEDACAIMRFAGLSPNIDSIGIYGYIPENDSHELTARQIAQMIWYFVDGRNKGRREASLGDKEYFVEYHTAFAEVETIFLQSKKTNRWWMQLPDEKYIACSYQDYLLASSNEVPERWLRAQER